MFRTNVANWSGAAFVFEPNQLVFSAPKSITSLASTSPNRSEDTNRAKSEKASIPLTRTISLDRSDDQTYQLELRLARKIEKLRKERENDILALHNLTGVVAKLKMAVYGLIFVTLLLLAVAVLDRNRIKALVMVTTTSHEVAGQGDSNVKKSERLSKAKKASASARNEPNDVDTTKEDSNADNESHSSDKPGKSHTPKKKGGK